MADYYLQEDGTSKFLLEDSSGFYILEGTSGTAYTEAATISSSTSVSGSDLFAAVDSSIVAGKTTPSGIEYEPHAYTDSATITSVTSLLGSYLTESFTLHTTDYDWAPWTIAYTFDGSIPVAGSVGMFDDDHGHIPGT